MVFPNRQKGPLLLSLLLGASGATTACLLVIPEVPEVAPAPSPDADTSIDGGGADARSEASLDAGDAAPADTGADAAPTVDPTCGPFTAASCATAGDGVSNCGAGGESCCTSLPVPGGTYFRSYASPDGGGTQPATVTGFCLDKYEVTVGRFRTFVAARGAGYRPSEGDGKHAHIVDGDALGLVYRAPDGTSLGHDYGWSNSFAVDVAATWNITPPPYESGTWSGGNDKRPITNVTMEQAYEFCIWDGGFLPSDAEWGYAAAGGSEQRTYPWGETSPGAPASSPYARFGSTTAAPVGGADAGAGRFGQMDLAGNVREWVLDRWYPDPSSPCVDCMAWSNSYSGGSVRGSGFRAAPAELRTSRYRQGFDQKQWQDDLGFRCARSPLPGTVE